MPDFAVFLTAHSDSTAYEGFVLVQAESGAAAIENVQRMARSGSSHPWEQPNVQFAMPVSLLREVVMSSGDPVEAPAASATLMPSRKGGPR